MGHTVKPIINTLEQSNNTCLWGITAFSLTDTQHNTSMEPSNNTCQWGITAFSKQQQCNPSVHSKSFRYKQSSSIAFSQAFKRYHNNNQIHAYPQSISMHNNHTSQFNQDTGTIHSFQATGTVHSPLHHCSWPMPVTILTSTEGNSLLRARSPLRMPTT